MFYNWNTAANGSGTAYNTSNTFVLGAADVTLYAQWSVMRAIGQAGGFVFYDKGVYSDGWRYLEGAPTDQSSGAQWGCTGTAIPGADGTAIGTGKKNTIDIDTACTTTGIVAHICANLNINGYDDWFLPSIDELGTMYINLRNAGVGGFGVFYYWSSSEYNSSYAWPWPGTAYDIGELIKS